jgi:hypothetical protein
MSFSDLPRLDWHAQFFPLLARSRQGIPVFYCDEMIAPSQGERSESSKARYAVQYWNRLGLPARYVKPRPACRSDIARAHDRAYVDGVLDLARDNGYGTRDPRVAESLPYVVGAFLDAAREAVNTGLVAVVPVADAQEAGFAAGRYGSTFNGFIAAALALKHLGLVRQVTILDFEEGESSGIPDLMARLGLDWITYVPLAARMFARYLKDAFLRHLKRAMEGAWFPLGDLLMVQASACMLLRGDRGVLTMKEMAERDRIVFEGAAALHVPVLWTLGSGYWPSLRTTLITHSVTMRECARVYAAPALSEPLRRTGWV